MKASIGYEWQPIEDLPADFNGLESEELRSLAGVWEEQREVLERAEALRVFNERLQREWAIETGILERIYSLDRGVTQLLIERGIDASLISHESADKDPELVTQIIRDHLDAVEGLFSFVKGERVLSTSYVKELHAALTKHQDTLTAVNGEGRMQELPLEHGQYKKWPNNPKRPDGKVHEYAPPEQTAPEMERLIARHAEHVEKKVPPEVEAAWLHHRFTQIHPFQDGNGRVARALATLVFIKAGWFPLAITRDHREQYIEGLERADAGHLEKLIALFSTIQRQAFVNALGVAGEVIRKERVDQVIEAARDVFKKRRAVLRAKWQTAKTTAQKLQAFAKKNMLAVAGKLKRSIGVYSPQYKFSVDDEPDGGERSYYFRHQVIATAQYLNYFANTGEYRAWTRLTLRTDEQADILVFFHGAGREFRGIMAASMCFFRWATTEKGEREIGEVASVVHEFFQINYREDPALAQKRFEAWLDRGIVSAVEIWRKGL